MDGSSTFTNWPNSCSLNENTTKNQLFFFISTPYNPNGQKKKQNLQINITKWKIIRRSNLHHYLLANLLQYLIKWIQNNNHNNSWIESGLKYFTFRLIILTDFDQENELLSKSTQLLAVWWKVNEITKSALIPCIYSFNLAQPLYSATQQSRLLSFLEAKKSHSSPSLVW